MHCPCSISSRVNGTMSNDGIHWNPGWWNNIHLELWTTIFDWMFVETTIFYVKIWFIIQLKQPLKKWLFRVPEKSFFAPPRLRTSIDFKLVPSHPFVWKICTEVVKSDICAYICGLETTWKALKENHLYLVGGFNPSEKYARQIGSSPQIVVKIKKDVKPHLQGGPLPVKNAVLTCIGWNNSITKNFRYLKWRYWTI